MVETNDIAQLKAIILAQQEEITSLRAVITDLQARLSLNSTNSHKPSSTDGYAKKHSPKPALPKQEGRPKGRQPVHPGKTVEMVATPDLIAPCTPPDCPTYGTPPPTTSQLIARRQVFDLPLPRLAVTEYQLTGYTCRCGCQVKATFPDSVTARVQYRPRIQALTTLLNTDYRVPFGEISQLMADLYGHGLNEATAIQANSTLFEQLVPIEAQIGQCLQASPVLHADETGLRVEGKLHWLHVVCSHLYAYLFVHPKRGKEALDSDQSLLTAYPNWLIHDCWGAYFGLTKARHGLCGAHIVRERQALVEQGSLWASAMQLFLLSVYQASKTNPIPASEASPWQARYESICQQGLSQEPLPQARPRGRPKQSKAGRPVPPEPT